MPEIIGDYQYSKRDLIGHGAFAIVFLGHSRNVIFFLFKIYFITYIYIFSESRTASSYQTDNKKAISKVTESVGKGN